MRLNSFLCLLAAPSVIAVGSFINPSGEDGADTFHLLEKVNVEWSGTSDYSALSLGYFSEHNKTVTWFIVNSPNYLTQYLWTVTPMRDGFDIEQDDQFHLWIVNGTASGSSFYSPMFYIRRRNETTSSEPTSVPTSAPPSNVPSDAATAGKGGDTSDGSEGGLSVGAKAGIGVGVAAAGLLIIGTAAFFILRRRKANQAVSGSPQAPPLEDKKDQSVFASETPAYPHVEPVEAPTDAPYWSRQELGGTVRAELEGDSQR